MKFIFSGGGTGGHIYPAITLIETIREKYPEAQILYVGTKKGLEADIVPKAGFSFKTIDIEGFERRFTLRNVVVLGKAFKGLIKAYKILKNFSPDAVIGTGGYVSGPILLMAALMKIPTLIQDQNAIPGITNKILSKFVTQIACGYQSACKHFPQEKTFLTGNPIRRNVMLCKRDQAIDELKLAANKKTILVTGGSRGARKINKAMLELYHHFADSDDIQILHITGKLEYERVMADLRIRHIDSKKAKNIFIKPYLYDMPQALAAADIIISRAGAIGLAEITARGIPSILIPYPYAAENHQEYNAKALVEAGAAVMILNKDLTGSKLIHVLDELLASEEKMADMRCKSKKMGYPNAAGDIAKMILSIVK
ncbi:undecaprenyldiphospho-muramoylpentapeptide beta-N-acetylglucosaminyltransferase [Pectinatus sottacetonis]|uniref:undecaprenyldiphospho-muramoylpentapeptide beta-N-acetylglucosaminyltransferase n=1 Tax=Pectinatus sottacetonis TaxID=1002795 RepID=UPI0018C82702|nr:undecaprenyldiphospho-muramoylpentapeptide beta-N-acetylglucosaminyltransferase [Pectinatus sottacetonis]